MRIIPEKDIHKKVDRRELIKDNRAFRIKPKVEVKEDMQGKLLSAIVALMQQQNTVLSKLGKVEIKMPEKDTPVIVNINTPKEYEFIINRDFDGLMSSVKVKVIKDAD